MKQSNDLYHQMILLTIRAKRHLALLCEKRGMTPVQGLVLIILETGSSKNMNELSETMGCDASNITGLVDRMEANHLIQRSSCDKDRRIKQIQLSPKGQKYRQEILTGLKKSELLDLSKLSESEKSELVRLICKTLC